MTLAAKSVNAAAVSAMKAVLYPFRPDEPIVELVRDFPQLQWAIAAAPGDIAREIGDAAILVTSNRVCSAVFRPPHEPAAPPSPGVLQLRGAGIGLRAVGELTVDFAEERPVLAPAPLGAGGDEQEIA